MKKEYFAPTVIAVRMSVPMNLCQTSNGSLNVYNRDNAPQSVDRQSIDYEGYYVGDIF